MSVINALRSREIQRSPLKRIILENILEDSFVSGQSAKVDYNLPHAVSSTIAIALSCNGRTVATTHGDHTVKIFIFSSGQQIRVFRGHPRTPWTVKYHPSDPSILASGCLGFEVRVWDIRKNACINMIRLEASIISLAFHPSGEYIAVASGAIVEVWKWSDKNCLGFTVSGTSSGRGYRYKNISHMRNIRAVIFHPQGEYLFIAAPDSPKLANETLTHCRLFAIKFFTLLDKTPAPEPLELYTQPCILPKVHLYSDGGLDISHDGEFLFTCAQLERNKNKQLSPSKNLILDSYTLSPMSHRDRLYNDVGEQMQGVSSVSSTSSSTMPTLQQTPPTASRSSNMLEGIQTPEIHTSSSASVPIVNISSLSRVLPPPPLPLASYVLPIHPHTNSRAGDDGPIYTNEEPVPSANSLLSFAPSGSLLEHTNSSRYRNMVFHSPIRNNTTVNNTGYTQSTQDSRVSEQEDYNRELAYINSTMPTFGHTSTSAVPVVPIDRIQFRAPYSPRNRQEVAAARDTAMYSDSPRAERNSKQPRFKDHWNPFLPDSCSDMSIPSEFRFADYKVPRTIDSNSDMMDDDDDDDTGDDWIVEDHLCFLKLNFSRDGVIGIPDILKTQILPGSLLKAVTSTKLSPTCRYALVGYGVRVDGEVQEHPSNKQTACELISLTHTTLTSEAIMCDVEDEVNVAQFHPVPGNGIVYGTKRGKVRSFVKA